MIFIVHVSLLEDEIATAIDRSLQQIDRSLFWVNPDCGLKTRKEDEVKDALTVLVNTVRKKRASNNQNKPA